MHLLSSFVVLASTSSLTSWHVLVPLDTPGPPASFDGGPSVTRCESASLLLAALRLLSPLRSFSAVFSRYFCAFEITSAISLASQHFLRFKPTTIGLSVSFTRSIEDLHRLFDNEDRMFDASPWWIRLFDFSLGGTGFQSIGMVLRSLNFIMVTFSALMTLFSLDSSVQLFDPSLWPFRLFV
ncbi:hypothetical protein M404DRAFT_27155 [Pisolithus tinctorius Marx 270]|uniref:Secreted protein n=1 Tax=Pisolithus tinctorius Marx 270 TaxID=870435 RepID=A0A0C3NRQ9_PISTI|nr:hypothetical protein M404DRAFT_27155 [Pisolithus tinctorius Marx 270]